MKYTDEQIDIFLDAMGIKMMSCQRDLFKSLVNTEDRQYILMPPRSGRSYMMEMMDKFYRMMEERK